MEDLTARLAALSPEKRALLERRLRANAPAQPAERIEARQGVPCPPLSFAQQRLWFLEQLEPGGSLYNLPFTARFSGPLSVPVVERALNEIVRRHEILRTCFVLDEGQPVQLIVPELRIALEVGDLRNVPAADREAEAGALITREAMRPFDLGRVPLLRAKLFRLAEDDNILLVNIHHILSDGWSMGVLYRELMALYGAFAVGQPSPLRELPMQYGDFAVWQRSFLSGERLERLLSFWKRRLDGMPALLELPTNHPRPRVQSFKGGSYVAPFPRQPVAALKELARQQDATLFMALLAVFKVLLYRYSGVTDMVVGSPVANRNRVELEGLIGFFVNTLVLRTDLSGDPTFREVLSRVRDMTLEAFAHQDLPFERLVEEMQPNRNLSHNPLFQVMFGLQNTEAQIASHNAPKQLSSGTSKFDLTLSASETAEGLTGVFEFNAELFEPQTIVALANIFGALLEGVAANPDMRISQLPLMSSAERAGLIEAAATRGQSPGALLVHELFEAQSRRTPRAVAVSSGGAELTYEAVSARSNQLARALRERGAGPETLVGLCMDRSHELVVGILGILKAGAAFVPLDPSYPKERLAYMLEDTRAPMLLTRSSLVEKLPPFAGDLWLLDDDWPRVAAHSAEPPRVEVLPDNLAYVIYTSGSTGRPKGVMIPHRSVCNSAQAQVEVFALSAGCRVLQFGSLSFDTSIYDLLMVIGCGGTLCLAPQEELLPGEPLAQTLLRERINAITIPPSALAVVPETTLPDLHTLVSGGEAPARELVSRWQRGRRFFNAYGPTETTIWATVSRCTSDDAPPIGRAIANTQAYVLDTNLEPSPAGWLGEIYLGGAGAGRGYLWRPSLTAERFVPDPFSLQPGARLYRTGDKGRLLPNGEIQFAGRADQQLKLRGYRIEPGEIEAVLLSSPGVREAAAVAQRTPAGETRIAAFCVAEDGQRLKRSELFAHLRQRLPEFMIPASLSVLDALPLNPSGKLDRAKLAQQVATNDDSDAQWVAPRTEIEEAIAAVFREVLELERVGVNDSFFKLGGHSLLATRAVTRINDTFGVALQLRFLFEFPTVAEIAAAVEQRGGSGPQQGPPAITKAARHPTPLPSADGRAG